MNQGEMEDGVLKNVGVGQGDMEYGVLIFAEAVLAGVVRNLSVKVAGAWTAVVKVFAKVLGTWEETDVKAKIDGAWIMIHEK